IYGRIFTMHQKSLLQVEIIIHLAFIVMFLIYALILNPSGHSGFDFKLAAFCNLGFTFMLLFAIRKSGSELKSKKLVLLLLSVFVVLMVHFFNVNTYDLYFKF